MIILFLIIFHLYFVFWYYLVRYLIEIYDNLSVIFIEVSGTGWLKKDYLCRVKYKINSYEDSVSRAIGPFIGKD